MRPGKRSAAAVAFLALAIIGAHGSPQAQSRFPKGEPGAGQRPARAGSDDQIAPSSLQAVFPAQVRCPEIASPYASRTRYDGSPRPPGAVGGGYHGGIDITLAEGTPLLALAAGTVVSKGDGGLMEGFYLWLRHAPEDTGLPDWVYSKYQHLESLPKLEVGAKVALAQTIGHSGKTGTVAKHYGPAGYPHLHLTTRRSSSGEEFAGLREMVLGTRLFDPLVVYYEAGAKLRDPAGSPPKAGAVQIPYAGSDGKVTPPGTRVVWPVACQAR